MDKFNKKGGAAAAGKGKARAAEPEEQEEQEAPRRGAAARSSGGRGDRAPPRRKSRFAGVKAEGDRVPFPPPGDYLLGIVGLRESNDSGNSVATVTFEVKGIAEGGTAVGEFDTDVEVGKQVSTIFMLSGEGARSGMSKLKKFMIAAAGFESEADFDDFDPDGEFIDECLDAGNDADIIGREVNGICYKGNPVAKKPGDYYREWSWPYLDGTKAINA